MGALSFLDRNHSIAKPGFSRWLVPPAALSIHLAIGQAYAFSVFKKPLNYLVQVSVAGGGLKAAWKALQPALKAFPKESTIAYNLSCYACQMNDLVEAKRLFEKAVAIGDKDDIKKRALSDSDLRPLWPIISKM